VAIVDAHHGALVLFSLDPLPVCVGRMTKFTPLLPRVTGISLSVTQEM
jgi:hypothetical protein